MVLQLAFFPNLRHWYEKSTHRKLGKKSGSEHMTRLLDSRIRKKKIPPRIENASKLIFQIFE